MGTGILSTSAGLLVMSPQVPVYWLWYCWIGFQVQNDHSGYHFPIMFSPEFHDYHHLKFHTSYGWMSFGIGFTARILNFKKPLFTRSEISAYIPQNPLGNLFLMKPSLNKNYNRLLELLHIIRHYQEMPRHQNKERIGTVQL